MAGCWAWERRVTQSSTSGEETPASRFTSVSTFEAAKEAPRTPTIAMAMRAEWTSNRGSACKNAMGKRTASEARTWKTNRRLAACSSAVEGRHKRDGCRSAPHTFDCATRGYGKKSLGVKQGNRPGRRAFRCCATEDLSEIAVLVNSCGGKMGHAVAETAVKRGLTLIPYSFTGNREEGNIVSCEGVRVELREPEEWDATLEEVKKNYPNFIVVDYTLPAAVNGNANFYAKNKLPFVMGTTGGDRALLLKTAEDSGVHAVIAPQMGKQVVALQASIEDMATRFPGAFSGYKLKVVESHQSSKVDTSGTAKAIVSSFKKLGLDFDESEIEKVRHRVEQHERMGVPVEYIDGHAFHTYTLTSPDDTVCIEFKHNVCGRSIYAQGSVDAVIFLHEQIRSGATKKIYNMFDVLESGKMT